ncbi:MAG: outer membrane lipoprotein LolB [Desulfuromonadales bacterium]|nr:outer membrane lipoprotein LolB [Desulfuromonadales bacterium]
MNHIKSFIIFAFAVLTFSGCATAPIVPIDPTANINNLSCDISLSIKNTNTNKGISGRGYLIMSLPDKFRMIILSPFGTTVAEMFMTGDKILYIASTENKAYKGSIYDVESIPALQGWRLLRWTTERVYPETPGQTELTRKRSDGVTETIIFDSQGLILKKSANGEEVVYEGYQSVGGVPVPKAITIKDRYGVKTRIVIEDPEVNKELDPAAFSPNLEGITVMPLRDIPGL